MKKLFLFFVFPLLVFSFTACTSNNDDGENVIPSVKQPKSVADMTMSYQNGLLTKIVTTDGTQVTFDYGAKTKDYVSNVQCTKMTIENEDGSKMYFGLTLGENGFIKNCTETYENTGDAELDNSVDSWEFGYNTDGQLNYMKRSEGGNEVTTVKYENGNITNVSMVSEEDGEKLNTKISYISADMPTAIENKNNIMLFDTTFGIDMDEMKYAYWAGILGKATKNLPVEMTDIEDGETETFQWTIKDDYIQKMIRKSFSETEEYLFTWE
jgi:hypothetical protein